MNRLLEIGFQPVGHWKLDAGMLVLDLKDLLTRKNILYTFVIDGEVKYIGKTTQSLKTRLMGYLRPAPTQPTNIRNNRNIREQLQRGKCVDIFALPDDGLLHYGGFHLNLAAGLEDSLIAAIRPEWNGQPSAEASPSEAEYAEPTPDLFEHETLAPSQAPPKFVLTLQDTYYHTGFFNIPIGYSKYFGGDLQKMSIYCGDNPMPVTGFINRTANKNNTPRIMGGPELKRWFQSISNVKGNIDVDVLSPTSIVLFPSADTGASQHMDQ